MKIVIEIITDKEARHNMSGGEMHDTLEDLAYQLCRKKGVYYRAKVIPEVSKDDIEETHSKPSTFCP